MQKINPYHILSLSPKAGAPSLSLYANTEREVAELLGTAEELGLKSYDPKTIDRLIRPLHRAYRSGGLGKSGFPLAFFSSRGFSGFARLPFPVKPLAVVAPSFHVKPLLKWAQREHPFCLLYLGNEDARLFQGSLSYFEEIERLPYRELRTMDGVFNAVDRAVYRSIQSSRVPLVLAGDVDLVELYRNVSGYRAIVDDSIHDSGPEDHRRLHAMAVRILEPFLEQRESNQLALYWAAERAGRASGALQEIVQLALAGKVKHLFVNEKMHVWGKINPATGTFTYHPQQSESEDDVLDDLAEIVIRGHGQVTILPPEKMPSRRAACAILNARAAEQRAAEQRAGVPTETWPAQAVS